MLKPTKGQLCVLIKTMVCVDHHVLACVVIKYEQVIGMRKFQCGEVFQGCKKVVGEQERIVINI